MKTFLLAVLLGASLFSCSSLSARPVAVAPGPAEGTAVILSDDTIAGCPEGSYLAALATEEGISTEGFGYWYTDGESVVIRWTEIATGKTLTMSTKKSNFVAIEELPTI